jgi:glycosyltransferase involved in cell wall biosynthesis
MADGPASKKPRVFLVTNIVAPYRLPVLRFLAGQKDFDLRVCYLARTERFRKWRVQKEDLGFDYLFLPGGHLFLPFLDWGLHLNFGLLWQFLRYRPTILICTGWDCPAYFAALLYARLMGCKCVLWSGTSGYRQVSRQGWVRRIKQWFIRRFDSYLSYGSDAADYLVEHGAPREKIAVGFNTVDVEFFARKAAEARRGDHLRQLRKEYPGNLILYVGRFLNFTRLDLLVEALGHMKERDWTCLLIGWGPEEAAIRQKANELGLSEKIEIVDFKPSEELAAYYCLARVFVLPSQWEPWGLVVNEAMACGTPVVVSQGAGSARDLVEEGVTGFSYPPEDPRALAAALDRLMRDDALCERMGEAAAEKIRAYTPERYARNLMRALFEL